MKATKKQNKAPKITTARMKSSSPQWDRVQACVDLLIAQGLTGFEWEDPSGFRISLKKEVAGAPLPMTFASAPVAVPAASRATEPAMTTPIKPVATPGKEIKCPFVGTFYASSSPTSAAYVRVGSKVKKGDTLCIIEAMKLMNSLEADENGEILEILAKNGEPVEFGTPLFRIRLE